MFPTRPVSAFIDRDFEEIGYVCDNASLTRPSSLSNLPDLAIREADYGATRETLFTDPLPRRASPIISPPQNMLLSSSEDLNWITFSGQNTRNVHLQKRSNAQAKEALREAERKERDEAVETKVD